MSDHNLTGGCVAVPMNMPSLDFESPTKHKKVFISIDEVDSDGNIISSKTLEAEELSDVEEIENAHVVADGYILGTC